MNICSQINQRVLLDIEHACFTTSGLAMLDARVHSMNVTDTSMNAIHACVCNIGIQEESSKLPRTALF